MPKNKRVTIMQQCGKTKIVKKRISKFIKNTDINIYTDINPQTLAKKQDLSKNTFTYFSGDMGCIWYVRNNNGKLEYFFMHSDDWGQYGDTTMLNKLNEFKNGYHETQYKK